MVATKRAYIDYVGEPNRREGGRKAAETRHRREHLRNNVLIKTLMKRELSITTENLTNLAKEFELTELLENPRWLIGNWENDLDYNLIQSGLSPQESRLLPVIANSSKADRGTLVLSLKIAKSIIENATHSLIAKNLICETSDKSLILTDKGCALLSQAANQS